MIWLTPEWKTDLCYGVVCSTFQSQPNHNRYAERSGKALQLIKYLVLDGIGLGLTEYIKRLMPFPATSTHVFREIVAGDLSHHDLFLSVSSAWFPSDIVRNRPLREALLQSIIVPPAEASGVTEHNLIISKLVCGVALLLHRPAAPMIGPGSRWPTSSPTAQAER